MKKNWWKILSVVLILYAIIGGLSMEAPNDLGILSESIRNLHYHVPMWFTMIVLLFVSYVYGIMYLNKQKIDHDSMASSFVKVALVFGIAGITTGSLWAKFTWGHWWINDPKLNGAAIGIFIYLAYYILRYSSDDELKTSRITAVYNLFAFPLFIVLILVYPKLAETSSHPGSGDTVGFNKLDIDNNLRMVFYPAVLGWILLGTWIATLKYRLTKLKRKDEEI